MSDVEFRWKWEDFIATSHPELPKGIRRSTLIAFANRLCQSGRNGKRCGKSDTKIAQELEISRMWIKGYRDFLLELGWFVLSPDIDGKPDMIGRVHRVDIAIPETATIERAAEVVEYVERVPTSHDDVVRLNRCQMCLHLVTSGQYESIFDPELAIVHAAGLV